MLVFTQLIYIKNGKEDMFHRFEDIVLPLIEKYKGNLMLRIRPGAGSFIAGTLETPYEIHMVSFPSETDFKNYAADETRKNAIHLKDESIRSVMLVAGKELSA